MKANLNFYTDKQKVILAGLTRLNGQSGILSFLRLLSFVGAVALVIWGFVSNLPVIYSIGFLLLILFVVLCIVHGKILSKIQYLTELNNVDMAYIARINGDFNELRNIAVSGLKRAEDIGLAKGRLYGKEFDMPEHDYCGDLDLFGKKSLFSLLNVSETSFGRRRFADKLLNLHASDITLEDIKKKQSAVNELCSKPDFLMEYQATAKCGKMTKDPKTLLDFAVNASKTKTSSNVLGIIGCAIWLIVPVAFLALPDFANASVPACLIVNLIIWVIGHAFNDSYIKACEGMPAQVSTIRKLFGILENTGFEDEYIKHLVSGKGETK